MAGGAGGAARRVGSSVYAVLMYRPARKLCLVLLAITAGIVLFPVIGKSARYGHAIRVTSAHGKVLAIFTSAKCRVSKSSFVAQASDGNRDFEVHVKPFKSGDHRYALHRGSAKQAYKTPTYIEYFSPHGNYASDFVPPYPVHGGGAVDFKDHDKLMGAGFSPTFNAPGTDAVNIAGVLECHYPKKSHH